MKIPWMKNIDTTRPSSCFWWWTLFNFIHKHYIYFDNCWIFWFNYFWINFVVCFPVKNIWRLAGVKYFNEIVRPIKHIFRKHVNLLLIPNHCWCMRYPRFIKEVHSIYVYPKVHAVSSRDQSSFFRIYLLPTRLRLSSCLTHELALDFASLFLKLLSLVFDIA